MKWISPTRVCGTVEVPPSKSLLQRAILAASMVEGTSAVGARSGAADVVDCLGVAAGLGATVADTDNGWRITGGGEHTEELDCGESATCLRLAAPLAAAGDHPHTLTARGSLLRRPMGMLVDALRSFGATVAGGDGRPWRVHGPLHAGTASVDGSVSSQHVSGLLMALPLCDGNSVLEVKAPVSLPYLALTVDVLTEFGIQLDVDPTWRHIRIPGRQTYRPADVRVEGDWSSAAFWMVAAAIAGEVSISGVHLGSRQADRMIVETVRAAGATVHGECGWVHVASGRLRPFKVNATHSPDAIPPLAALAAHCPGTSTMRGVSRLSAKESDRGRSLCAALNAMGIDAEVAGDLLHVAGGKPSSGRVESAGDHRIAMAAAVCALGADAPVCIVGSDCVAKSYPTFFDDLGRITA